MSPTPEMLVASAFPAPYRFPINPPSMTALRTFSGHLTRRREAVLKAWERAVANDPEQATSRSLTRGQFRDHIPQVLDAFQRKLCSVPGGSNEESAGVDQKQEEVKHGLHRWQQGYRLQELMMEWGHLHVCLFEELQAYAESHAEFSPGDHANAHRQLIALVNEAIGESTGQYERMEQAEAAGHFHALKIALDDVNQIEHRRSALIHQAVHDIGSNVFGVDLAVRVLGRTDIAAPERDKFLGLIQQGTRSLTQMLTELMTLARLEAGHEKRELARFNVGSAIREVCQMNQLFAAERALFLTAEGTATLSVEGDSDRMRRILQNLVTNALKYTAAGGVVVTWGEEKDNWWLMVKDTGPGFSTGPDRGLTDGLKEATASARESDVKVAASGGASSHVLRPELDDAPRLAGEALKAGEGIGLSIVKRLCELLDASIELASSAESGTTFRVVFPMTYSPKKRPA